MIPAGGRKRIKTWGRARWWLAALLAGLGLLLLWWLRPAIATTIANNLGSVALNRALLAPNLSLEERQAWAVKAGRHFETALAWDPLNDKAYGNLAIVYGFWEDTPSVARAAARAAALNPGDVIARFRLGQALAAQGYEEQAREHWRAAGAAHYFLTQGLALNREGDHQGALAQYERAVAVAPESAEAYYRLGQALSATGRTEEAVAALEVAASLEPVSSPRRHLLQGEVHAAREEWTAALAAYARSAEVAPRDPAPHHRMGWLLHRKLEDEAGAIAHYEWALQLDPGYIPSRLALGALFAGRGQCDHAAQWMAPLFSREVGHAVAGEAHFRLGVCLVAQERADDGLPHLEQAAALKPDSVWYALTLAQAYSQEGRYGEAIEAYVRVLELEPDNARARQALDELGWSEP